MVGRSRTGVEDLLQAAFPAWSRACSPEAAHAKLLVFDEFKPHPSGLPVGGRRSPSCSRGLAGNIEVSKFPTISPPVRSCSGRRGPPRHRTERWSCSPAEFILDLGKSFGNVAEAPRNRRASPADHRTAMAARNFAVPRPGKWHSEGIIHRSGGFPVTGTSYVRRHSSIRETKRRLGFRRMQKPGPSTMAGARVNIRCERFVQAPRRIRSPSRALFEWDRMSHHGVQVCGSVTDAAGVFAR